MTLQEVLDRLARGKISNLAICENGKIKEKFLPKVVDAVNEALSVLYTKFVIKENSLFLELYEGRTEYPLTSEHSTRNRKGDIFDEYDFYIRDTEENPFEDDILTVLEVWDDLDRRRPINDPDDPLAVFIGDTNVLSVNYTASVRVLNVIYRVKHKELKPNVLEETIKLPSNLFAALFSYVAYLLHSEINTQEAVANSQKYLGEFNNLVSQIIESSSLNPDKLVSDVKFICRGWV